MPFLHLLHVLGSWLVRKGVSFDVVLHLITGGQAAKFDIQKLLRVDGAVPVATGIHRPRQDGSGRVGCLRAERNEMSRDKNDTNRETNKTTMQLNSLYRVEAEQNRPGRCLLR